MKQPKRARKRIVKVQINVRFELPDYSAIIDDKGHFYRMPFKAPDGRIFRLKYLKPFYHVNYSAIQIKQRILSISKLQDMAKPVSYSKRFDMVAATMPDNIRGQIIADVSAADTVKAG